MNTNKNNKSIENLIVDSVAPPLPEPPPPPPEHFPHVPTLNRVFTRYFSRILEISVVTPTFDFWATNIPGLGSTFTSPGDPVFIRIRVTWIVHI